MAHCVAGIRCRRGATYSSRSVGRPRALIVGAIGLALVSSACAAPVAPLPPAAAPSNSVAVTQGWLIVARPSTTGTVVTAYRRSTGGPAASTLARLPEVVQGIVARRDATAALCWRANTAYQIDLATGSAEVLWRSRDRILQLSEARPPGAAGSPLLALTAEAWEGGHYLRSHLYLLAGRGGAAPRLLSPPSGYNFWSLSVADVDGDGAEDVGLCTWSRAVRDRQWAPRFSVYSWSPDGDLYPRWHGSRLCRPYVGAGLARGRNGVALLAQEIGLQGGSMLVTYNWNQFGFWGTGHTREYIETGAPHLGDVDADERDELVARCTEADGVSRVVAFHLDQEQWVPTLRSAPVPRNADIVLVPTDDRAIIIVFATHDDPAPTQLMLHSVERGQPNADQDACSTPRPHARDGGRTAQQTWTSGADERGRGAGREYPLPVRCREGVQRRPLSQAGLHAGSSAVCPQA